MTIDATPDGTAWCPCGNHHARTVTSNLCPSCEPAIGYRIDEGQPYPVCRKHLRPPYWMTARSEAGR